MYQRLGDTSESPNICTFSQLVVHDWFLLHKASNSLMYYDMICYALLIMACE